MARKGVSLRAFGKSRGVSLTAVQKAIKTGRITKLSDGSLDLKRANRDWDENTEVSKQRKDTSAVTASVGGGASLTYAQARAAREAFRARTEQLIYEQRIGKLVLADGVKLEAFQAARLTRDTLLNIPNKICHELAAETD